MVVLDFYMTQIETCLLKEKRILRDSKAYSKGIELRGKTIGIIGFGRIGQEVAKVALGVGMNVIASDKFIKKLILK